MTDKDGMTNVNWEGEDVTPEQVANNEATPNQIDCLDKRVIGKVLTAMQKIKDRKIIEKNKSRENEHELSDYMRLFKYMDRGDYAIVSRIEDSHICFYAKRPKSCKRCLMFDDSCCWGFETFLDDKTVRPKKRSCCVPFKIRGYTLTEEQIEKHVESIIAHAHDMLDRYV